MILAFSIADLIRVPFGYLMDFLYQFTSNYGMALILFALLVKLILLPASAKSKKSMMKMSRFLRRTIRHSFNYRFSQTHLRTGHSQSKLLCPVLFGFCQR